MCRWMAYSGEPLLAEDLLFRPQHSLIDQSLHSKMGATTTNGDGFGIGWYGEGSVPAVFKSVDPAWNDRNLREVAAQIRTPLMFAHIRASTGTPVQRSNCHPFRYDRWLFVHNGFIDDVHRLFHSSLARLGVLALGHKESIAFTSHEADYDVINADERLYRKMR